MIFIIMEKTCNKCGLSKELSNFIKRKTAKDGYGNTCKICTRNYMISYYELNSLKLSEYHKEYRIKNSDKNKEYQLIYNSTKKAKDKKREYYDKNIQYYRDIEKNEERKKYRYNYNKNSYTVKWRSFLRNSLKRLNKPKEGKTIELLGYSALDLKYHLESLFTDGMTWDNYGEWHIDHIKPISSFDKNTPIMVINMLNNLQPLWATTREINGIVYEGNINKSNN